MVEGDVLADVEQAVPVAAHGTIELLDPQATADRVVDRTEGLPPFDIGGDAHAIVVVVGVAVGLRALHIAGVAVGVVLGAEAESRRAVGQTLGGTAIGVHEVDLAAVAAAVDRPAAEVLRLRATGAIVADIGQVRRQPVTAALHAVPVGGHRRLETVAAIKGRAQVAEGVLAQCA
ncbi:hypothetical protein D3C72_1219420 [compost metagenome]